ncbi:MAG: ADP-ribosylglycohydrolase family protein [Planctomycetaceae bacterium]
MPQYARSLFDDEPDGSIMLEDLFNQGQVALRRGRVFDMCPDTVDTKGLLADFRIEGMLVGVAVGDALGHCTEWQFSPESRHEKYGTIADHLTVPGIRSGRISDDTQMTYWTLDRILHRGWFDFEDVVGCFVDRHDDIVGMGRNTSASLTRHQRRMRTGLPLVHECVGDPAEEGRGNGALMRFSPIVLPWLKTPSKQLWADAVLSSLATHGNTVTLSSVVAMTHLLWKVLAMPQHETPSPMWWIDEYLRIAGDLETNPLPDPLNTDPVPLWYDGFRGTLCDFIDQRVRKAFVDGVPLRDACSLDGFGSRADSLQTVPAVLYTMMCHADSFESAIITAVNDTKDNDTIAAIVGAFVGAIHGLSSIRQRWIHGIRSYSLKIPGRTSQSDRDVVMRMATEAALHFCGHASVP